MAAAEFAATYPMSPRNPGSGGQEARQLQAWIGGPEPGGGRALVVLANYGPDEGQGGFGSAMRGRQRVAASWEDLGLDTGGGYAVRNVWTGEEEQAEGGLEAELDEGESVLLWSDDIFI
ncbi:alpha-galactosidase [Cordyceps fumosorosea ARSEF 2679]|uniref:Alpha-galactosidase n=1 Tax=Cordyceps fumosorosea (strain ARSEF 2679) TaxID=1081104 RepID=A0A167NKF4_CORFA|nr:alpha-galactosidase [Cordyceps fumosorosea ARSEF 2679]OAA55647.1 alpha-galactosidase [Cordyceps fumosorosea ARSEF 2679]